MILFELYETENNEIYQKLEVENVSRQYDFLQSIVTTSIEAGQPFLSQHIIKSLNYHAITCLHAYAGEYRPCAVAVGSHRPPQHHRVQSLMDAFVNRVNRSWESTDPLVLAAYVLWRLNHIHPFINGNGRTARAACHFVLCVALNGWLPGKTLLPELIRRERRDYEAALEKADRSHAVGNVDLSDLHALLERLLREQLASAQLT